MFELKPLSQEAVAGALAKAERYRLLNEPEEAESICQDILAIDPAHQPALIMLILAITDQFRDQISGNVSRAQGLLPRLASEYDRLYLHGLLCERRAKAYLTQGGLKENAGAYDWLREAMRLFEQAEKVRPAGNDDAVLRWNACVRTLERHPHLRPEPDEHRHAIMSE
jgi:hypothetical protein